MPGAMLHIQLSKLWSRFILSPERWPFSCSSVS
jgi:hypothetical protein